ncbi:uncharacterized protein LOC108028353 [Drosophila biarmipes]|uniref:uncharacterized protein LOC108028353 n=1 Tax=Drosophila biarmipes TaxID=125945 RepID=UPI001CDB1C89|nr:uncharacterized protein LOC108028353 [Drosophila biarmipes]
MKHTKKYFFLRIFYYQNCLFMERLQCSIPINPNAKYLSNSISNVLYSIQKFDESTLAWPTHQRTRDVCNRKKVRSPPEVPLAGTASCVIPKKRCCALCCNAKAAKKNTYYQILQASQDQPHFKEGSRCKYKNNDYQFKRDSKNDSIYNDIYDIVRTHVNSKRQPQYEKCPDREVSLTMQPPKFEVYKILPVPTKNMENKSKHLQSTARSPPKSSKLNYPIIYVDKLRERTNELSNSKGRQTKPKSSSSKKEFLKFLKRGNQRNENLKEENHRSTKMLRSKSLTTKQPFNNISKGREKIAQTSPL